MIFDRDGNFLVLGAGLFTFPHAIRIVEENGQDVIWLCDEHHQQFQKFTTTGKLLQTIGEKGARSDTGVPADDFSSAAWKKVTHGGGPFNLPTNIAFAPDGSMFMTDGYGNPRVHKFSPVQVQVLLGRAGHRAGPIQSAARRLDRPARPGPSGRPRKRPPGRYSTRTANCCPSGRPN